MIPLRDTIPSRRLPIVTWFLIAVNIGVFAFELSLGPQVEALVQRHGLIPVTYVLEDYSSMGLVRFVSPWVTSLFLHGGVLHLGFNMLYLWVFADNVEDVLGHFPFACCYLLSGIGASVLHVVMQSSSTVPVIGASGAIAGILGAYWLLFPRARIRTLIPLGFMYQTSDLPAVVFLGLWIALQVLSGTAALRDPSSAGGVAWWAHVGGFVTGIACVLIEGRRPFRLARAQYAQSDQPDR